MLKILILLVIYYVIIKSTDSRNVDMSENEFINDRNSSNYTCKTGCNNTDRESKNVTTSEHIAHVELTGSLNNSKNSTVLNINQISAIKEIFDLSDGRTYEKELRTVYNNVTEESKNITVSPYIIPANLTGLQNSSEKSTAQNHTSLVENKSIHINETKDFLDSLSGRTHEQGLTPGLIPNLENAVIANNTNNTTPEVLGSRISGTAITTLVGGGGPG